MGTVRALAFASRVGARLFLALALGGCGAGESMIGGGEAARVLSPQTTETITIWHTYSDVEERAFLQEAIPAFERDNPGIRVVAVKKPYENIKGGLIAESTSGAGPDVVRLDMAWVPEFAKLKLIDTVDQYPEFDELRGVLQPTALETSKYGGRYYGVPLNLNTKAAIYSRELLDRAGVDEPPATMDELAALARRTGYPLGVGGISSWALLPYFSGLGGRLTNADYTRAIGYLDGPESLRAALALKSLMDEGLFSPDSLSGKLDRWGAVRDGELLMIDEGPWFYPILTEVEGGNGSGLLASTVAAPFPHNPGTNGAIIGGESLVLMNSSPRKQAAWTFMKWMTGVPAQQAMFRTGLLPTNREANESPDSLGPTIRPFVDSLGESFLRPPVANWTKIDKAFNDAFDRMLHGLVPVEEGLHKLAAEVDALLRDENE